VEGRDHPGPGDEDACGPAVSLVVTSRERETFVLKAGLAERLHNQTCSPTPLRRGATNV
jgi:hypothetical protein